MLRTTVIGTKLTGQIDRNHINCINKFLCIVAIPHKILSLQRRIEAENSYKNTCTKWNDNKRKFRFKAGSCSCDVLGNEWKKRVGYFDLGFLDVGDKLQGSKFKDLVLWEVGQKVSQTHMPMKQNLGGVLVCFPFLW